MTQSLLILGRQPALGLAELESLYGGPAVQPVPAASHISPTSGQTNHGTAASLLDRDPSTIDFARLGGSVKLAATLAVLDKNGWPAAEAYLRKNIMQIVRDIPGDAKLKLGLSAYNLTVTPAKLGATALTLKKILRASGRSVRVVPNKEPALNSAQVLHNGLNGPAGCELIIFQDGNRTILARTIAEQDIDAYAARDQGRPKRDARVGMLPPKLAQIIINLAAADTDRSRRPVVLDPFCGTGVILQEATLMGFDIYGSDIDPRMIDYSDRNLMWLQETYGSPVSRPASHTDDPAWRYFKLEQGDATSHAWKPAPDFVACETYLGQPFSATPQTAKLAEVRAACNLILRKFLRTIGRQLPSGARLCLAVPAWQTAPGRFSRLPFLEGTPETTLDHLHELGYNRVSFKHVEPSDLIYARADQIVARELLVLNKY